jgi:hypothetical protein
MNKYQLKAEELYKKMLFCYQGHIDEYTAKQCALIAVDELIANEHLEAGDVSFWEPVKDELLKM